VKLDFYSAVGQRGLFRHPLNDRCHLQTIKAYAAIIAADGLRATLRNEIITVVVPKGAVAEYDDFNGHTIKLIADGTSSFRWVVGGMTMIEAFYYADCTMPTNEFVVFAKQCGIPHTTELNVRTPADVVYFFVSTGNVQNMIASAITPLELYRLLLRATTIATMRVRRLLLACHDCLLLPSNCPFTLHVAGSRLTLRKL